MSVREIKINHPGDGDWIMLRVGGVFHESTDHTVAVHRDGRMVGGVVYTWYVGSAIMLHMAGVEDNWATRDFLWMVFHYAFVQLGVRKVMGFVSSSNTRALKVDDHLGFKIATRVPDVFPDGSDLVILVMTKPQCKWLKLTPKQYQSNQEMAR
jgi:RimJ/RimL family protein N-acetyltransferase